MASSNLRRRSLVVVTLAALAAGVTSCGGSGASKTEAQPPALGAIKPITSYDQVSHPIAPYLPTKVQERTILTASFHAASVCAQRQGVAYHPAVPQQPTILESDMDRRYGVVNRAEVDRYGYDLPPSPYTDDDEKDPNEPRLSPHEDEVINGKKLPPGQSVDGGATDREGGCLLTGDKQVDPDRAWDVMLTFMADFSGTTYDEMVADPRFLQVQDAWVACMKKRWGYEFQHRWDAGNSIASKPMAAQKLMAKRDLTCAQAVNYPGTLYAIDTAYQKRYIAAHASEVQAIMTGWKAMLERAQKVLSE